MSKMARPMMKVVKFGAEDVIATSGAARGTFVALGTEIREFENKNASGVDGTYANTDALYMIDINGDGDYVYVQLAGDTGDPYAWYNKSNSWGWTTEGRPASFYGVDLPK